MVPSFWKMLSMFDWKFFLTANIGILIIWNSKTFHCVWEEIIYILKNLDHVLKVLIWATLLRLSSFYLRFYVLFVKFIWKPLQSFYVNSFPTRRLIFSLNFVFCDDNLLRIDIGNTILFFLDVFLSYSFLRQLLIFWALAVFMKGMLFSVQYLFLKGKNLPRLVIHVCKHFVMIFSHGNPAKNVRSFHHS